MGVMLRFPYQDEALTGPPPPSLPASAVVRWRPLAPVTIIGPGGAFHDFGRAVLDPAADDTVFPLDTAHQLGIRLRPDTGHRVRWRGQLHALRFGDAELLLTDNTSVWRWPAVVGFSPAPLRYPILGQAGCLQFIDARFLGADRMSELEINRDYPGSCT
jgi:hypothetical protein